MQDHGLVLYITNLNTFKNIFDFRFDVMHFSQTKGYGITMSVKYIQKKNRKKLD